MTNQMIRVTRELAAFHSLVKTDKGRLKQAGKAIIEEGIRDGMSQSEIAKLLKITPGAVSYHVNN